ncbi:MAG: hypothetical protein A2Z77_09135, partial [Chloroflexi bacterium RBG_13_51_36]
DECKGAILAGIGCYTSETGSAIEITDFIKSNFSIPVIWGGWHPTLFPVQTCEDKNVDAVVIGEGDYSFLKLVQSYEASNKLQDISGIAYKEGNKVIVSEPDSYINIEELPPVRYDLVDLSRYSASKLTDYFSRSKNVWLPYQSSRGCPHRCAFCINTVTNNNRYRAKTAKKVLEEVQVLIEKHGLTHLRIIDDNFFVDCGRVRDICQGFIENNFNITWDAECRVDYFRDGHLDDELLELCTKSGLVELTLGCESGSQRILDLMRKDIKVEQIINCVKQCHKHKIVPRCSFMVGIPSEKKEEILMTAKLINQLKDIAPEMAFGVATFRPYPKSEMCEDLLQKGVFKEPKTLREWATKRYMEYYTERTHKQPWQIYPALAHNVSFYYTAAGGVLLTNQQIKSKLLKRVNSFFINLANKRTRNLFFGFPIDKYFYNFFYRTYFKIDTFMKNRNQRKNA